ncbi:MAG: nicotinate-nucleotide adenylyltransferase [Alphaproteobacteria bacterium]|nr:nicotinate-nucleotide adenylyltransferase [Alphaproteobacteria bacterium]
MDLISKYNDNTVKKVGLLGGSFNPAHKGHLHISLEALKRLALDEVWWLVSPQNPLKPTEGMASVEQRKVEAQNLANNPKIIVTDIERRLGTNYTVDTLGALRYKFSSMKFVWLMGADNMHQIPQWKNWREIFDIVPVAVFDRKDYSKEEMSGEMAKLLNSYKIAEKNAATLIDTKPPAWVFIHNDLCNISSTNIRKQQKRK